MPNNCAPYAPSSAKSWMQCPPKPPVTGAATGREARAHAEGVKYHMQNALALAHAMRRKP